jgi:hypothetical protein
MLELLGWGVAGLVSYFLLMLKYGALRESAGTVVLICSAIGLIFLVGAGLDYGSGRRDFAAVVRLLVFYAGFIVAYAIHLWRRRASGDSQRRAALLAEQRFAELAARAASPQFELPVHGSAQVFLRVGAFGIGACLVLLGRVEGSALMIAGGIGLAAAAALLLLHSVSTLGRPRLVVTPAGFRLPLAPMVAWQLVEGIWLEQNRYNQRVIAHKLLFYVPTLPDWIGRFPWFTKLLYPLRTRQGKRRLAAVLAHTSEDPDVVYRVARHLWKQSTGRDYPWFPDMKEEAAAAYRQSDEHFARLRDYSGTDLTEVARLSGALEQNAAVMRTDLQQRVSRLRWMSVAFIVVAIALIAGALVAP